MKDNGEIELIKNAKVLNDGEHLQFTAETLSPFAIVVDTGADTPDGPQTGDNNMNHIYLIIMIASALALAVVLVMNKKQRA
jgi:LPXTG-motif cell wall-anchored protein